MKQLLRRKHSQMSKAKLTCISQDEDTCKSGRVGTEALTKHSFLLLLGRDRGWKSCC